MSTAFADTKALAAVLCSGTGGEIMKTHVFESLNRYDGSGKNISGGNSSNS
jgi:hypothetical protein